MKHACEWHLFFALDEIIKMFGMVEKHVLGNSRKTKDYHAYSLRFFKKHNSFTTFAVGSSIYENLAGRIKRVSKLSTKFLFYFRKKATLAIYSIQTVGYFSKSRYIYNFYYVSKHIICLCA